MLQDGEIGLCGNVAKKSQSQKLTVPNRVVVSSRKRTGLLMQAPADEKRGSKPGYTKLVLRWNQGIACRGW